MLRSLVLQSLLLAGTSSTLAEAAVKGDRSQEFIYDWSALGSGCRGQQSVSGGNVEFLLNPSKAPSLNRYQLRFVLERFRLESPVPRDQGPTHLEFARDCAIRVALNPPPGKRIVDIEAVSNYRLSKEASSEMKTMAQLTLGMTTLATARLEFPLSQTLRKTQHELRLVPQRSAGDLAEVRCGQSKLLGLDLLFYINRSSPLAKVDMNLEDQEIDVLVDLEDCDKA